MQNRFLLGATSLCLGVLVFSLQDLLIKLLSGSYPVTEAMTIRSIVALPILAAIVHMTTGLRSILSPRAGLLALRALLSLGAYMSYYLAFPALPLANAVALFFIAPLYITAMAVPLLGEKLDFRTAIALAVGLAGTLVMLRPGADVFEWAALLPLSAAVLYGSAQLLARKISGTETAAVITFYQNLGFLFGAPAMMLAFRVAGIEHAVHPSVEFLVRPWVVPGLFDLALLGSCGVIAAAGMVLLSQAYRLAPANKMAPFEYTAILWTPLWAFLALGEIPAFSTILGATLVIGAGIYALRARETKEEQADAADSVVSPRRVVPARSGTRSH